MNFDLTVSYGRWLSPEEAKALRAMASIEGQESSRESGASGETGEDDLSLAISASLADSRRAVGGQSSGHSYEELSREQTAVGGEGLDEAAAMVAHIVGNSEPGEFEEQLETSPTAAAATADSSLLIPGLPDDLAKQCLGRVPRWHHGCCKAVCKFWEHFFSSDMLLTVRQACGVQEDWLYVFSADPSITPGEAYDPIEEKWVKIALMPSEPFTHGFFNFVCAPIGHELLVLGGVLFDPSNKPVASARVYKYDALRNAWTRMADMQDARSGLFACGVVGKRVIVAGGATRVLGLCRGAHGRFFAANSFLNSAELYDLDTDTWQRLSSMNKIRSECVGLIVESDSNVQFLALGGRGASLPNIIDCQYRHNDAEAYDFSTGQWIQLGDMRDDLPICGLQLSSEAERPGAWGLDLGPVAYLGGLLYTLSSQYTIMFGGQSLRVYDSTTHTWRLESTLSRTGVQARFFGLNGELYVLPEEVAFMRPRPPLLKYNPTTKVWTWVGSDGFAARNGMEWIRFPDRFITAVVSY